MNSDRLLLYLIDLKSAVIGERAHLETLSKRQYKKLLVATEIYRQQLLMYENKTKRVDDRIVSLSQPHVRPIQKC